MASEFKVGDLVVFADEDQVQWQGGKGIVREVSDNHYDVEILELPECMAGDYWEVGSIMTDSATNLKHYAEKEAEEVPKEAVAHPAHYGGDTTYEVIKVAEAWGLDKDAYLFNVLKYIARAGKKDGQPVKQDLEKARFYVDRRIGILD